MLIHQVHLPLLSMHYPFILHIILQPFTLFYYSFLSLTVLDVTCLYIASIIFFAYHDPSQLCCSAVILLYMTLYVNKTGAPSGTEILRLGGSSWCWFMWSLILPTSKVTNMTLVMTLIILLFSQSKYPLNIN